MSDVGRAVLEAVQLVSRVGTEIEHLAALMKSELSALMNKPEIKRLFVSEQGWQQKDMTDDSGWVYTATAFSLPLKVGRQQKIGAYLFFQISLGGDGIAARGNHSPIIHIGLWPDPIDFTETLAGFPLHVDEASPVILENNTLFKWPAGAPRYTPWAYSLNLVQISSLDDIKHRIVEPVRSLLLGGSTSEALPGALEGIVHYTEVLGEPGHFEVNHREVGSSRTPI